MPNSARAARIWNDVITRLIHMENMIDDTSSLYNDVKDITWQDLLIRLFHARAPRYSFDTTSLSDIEASVAATMIAATTARPKV